MNRAHEQLGPHGALAELDPEGIGHRVRDRRRPGHGGAFARVLDVEGFSGDGESALATSIHGTVSARGIAYSIRLPVSGWPAS